MEERVFRELSYEAMNCVFSIHREFGRFFDETIYKREFARRFPNTDLEVPIEISFEGFRKLYFIDALINSGAIFEFKTVEQLTERHRAQLLNYLLITEIPRGKLINLRAEKVQHKYVNAPVKFVDRTRFDVVTDGWQEVEGRQLQSWMIAFLKEIGVGLDLNLYEDALTYVLGGKEHALGKVAVTSHQIQLGSQSFRMAAPDVAVKVTSLKNPEGFQTHAKRLINHTSLKAIQWINITRKEVCFRTLQG